MKTRVCTKCGEEKPETAEYFYRAKSCRGGLCTICKECIKEKNRRWDAENPEKVRERNRRWEDKNPEKVREAKKRWRAKNLEKAREAEKRWRAENPEKQREKYRRRRNSLAPAYLKNLISAKYNIGISEIGDELITAKRRELKYHRQLNQLKK